MTYTSTFAQHLSDLVKKNDFAQTHLDIFNKAHWHDLYNTSHNERHALIFKIMGEIIDESDLSADQDVDNELCGEIITFLAMTIPYEPLSINEQRHASQIASYIDEQDNFRKSFHADKLKKAKEFMGLYAVLERIPNKTNIGTYSLCSKAPDYIKKLFNNSAAFYMPWSLRNNKDWKHLITPMAPDRTHNIAFDEEYLCKATDSDVILTGVHEMRHYLQSFIRALSLEKSNATSCPSYRRIESNNRYVPEIISLEERQAYAFEGWIEDAQFGRPLRSELQITCDILLWNYGFGADVIDPIYEFNDFALQLRETQLHAAIYSPCKNRPRVS